MRLIFCLQIQGHLKTLKFCTNPIINDVYIVQFTNCSFNQLTSFTFVKGEKKFEPDLSMNLWNAWVLGSFIFWRFWKMKITSFLKQIILHFLKKLKIKVKKSFFIFLKMKNKNLCFIFHFSPVRKMKASLYIFSRFEKWKWHFSLLHFNFYLSEKSKNWIFTLILIRCIVHFPNHIIAECVVLYSFKMAALADILSVEAVRELVQNHTLEEVSNILQTEFPNQRGLSVKSIKRFLPSTGNSEKKYCYWRWPRPDCRVFCATGKSHYIVAFICVLIFCYASKFTILHWIWRISI